LEQERFDLILLDIMLPGARGYELMDYIRPMEIPVIFLTAKGAVDKRVRGLHLGTEDYIAKPFEIVELIARVEVVLRRCHKLQSVLTYRVLRIDIVARLVKRNGVPVDLTPWEFDLLVLLV
jgi:two-component system alkaline phosphatase synthesis response regulator PhoP